MNAPSHPVRYRRGERLLWRVLPGMVMTQSVDGDPGTGAAELRGRAAQVWLVLDEPMSHAEIVDALRQAEEPIGRESLECALSALVRSGHVVELKG